MPQDGYNNNTNSVLEGLGDTTNDDGKKLVSTTLRRSSRLRNRVYGKSGNQGSLKVDTKIENDVIAIDSDSSSCDDSAVATIDDQAELYPKKVCE